MIHLRQLVPASIAVAVALAACSEPPTGPLGAVSADRSPVATVETSAPSVQFARLLKCPLVKSGSTWGIVDASGGQLSVNGHSIRVPAGAVSNPTRFTLSVAGIRGLTVEIEAEGSGAVIAQPLGLTISYAGCSRQDIGRRSLRVLDVGAGAGSTSPVTPVVVDAVAHTLSLAARHSVYVVAY